MTEKLVFVNPTDKDKGRAENCNCSIEISDGEGVYSDVYTVYLCDKHYNKSKYSEKEKESNKCQKN